MLCHAVAKRATIIKTIDRLWINGKVVDQWQGRYELNLLVLFTT